MSWKKIGLTSGFVMAGTVATQLLQWVIMASIAHSEGPKVLGLYALGQAFALPIQYLSWLSIRQRYLTLDDAGGRLSDFVFLRATAPALAYAAALGVIAIAFADAQLTMITALLFVFKYIEGFYDLIYAVMQKDGDARLLARLSIIRAAVSGGIFVATYHLTKSLYVAMIVTAVQQAGLLVFVRQYLREETDDDRRSAYEPSVLRRRYSLALELFPVGLSLVMMSLNTSLPRVLLNGMIGAKELGYFAAIISFTSLGAIATGSLGQSLLQPLAASIAAKAERSFWRQLLWPMLLVNLMCGLGAVISYFVGSSLLRLVYGPAFEGIVPLLIAGALSSGPVYAASIANNGIFAAYMRGALFWIQAFTVASTAVGTLLLVPLLGVVGIFVAVAVSGVLQILVSVVILRRFWTTSKTIDPSHDLTRSARPNVCFERDDQRGAISR